MLSPTQPARDNRDSRMARVFVALAVSQVLMMLVTAGVGLAVGDPAVFLFHFVLGLVTTLLTVFVHCIVFTYFIVTAKLIKEACDKGRLEPAPVEESRRAKTRIILLLSLAVLLTLGPVVSGALAVGEPAPSGPERAVAPAEVHFATTVIALLANVCAFFAEYHAIRRNSALVARVFSEFGDREDRGFRRHGP